MDLILREGRWLGARLVQLMWLPACVSEIISDLSVFHRIRRPERMASLRFVQFAELLPAYSGAVAALFRSVLARRRAQDGTDGNAGQQSPDAVFHPDAADLFG